MRERTAELAAVNQTLQAEILERMQAQEVLLKQSGVLRSILDSIGDAIIVAEDLEKPLTFNPAAQELFGIGPNSVSIDEWLEHESLPARRTPRSLRRRPRKSTGPLSLALRGEEIDNLELIVRAARSGPGEVGAGQRTAARATPAVRTAGPWSPFATSRSDGITIRS